MMISRSISCFSLAAALAFAGYLAQPAVAQAQQQPTAEETRLITAKCAIAKSARPLTRA
jgi:hypothetical protein